MKIRILQGLALISVLSIAACAEAPGPASGSAADEATLRAIGTKYADAFNTSDIPALAAMVTDDYQMVGPDGTVVKGRAAFEEMEKASAARRIGLPLKLSVQTSYVKWASASAASLGGTWTMAGIPAGMGADKGSWTMLAEKGADGQWRLATGLIAEYHATPEPPAATPMPTPEPVKGKGK